MLSFVWVATQGLPYDDGKYYPEKYKIYNDGKYYRPLSEGKYVPGDEGKYTYVYQQGLYPEDDGDYRYIHQAGPEGGFGGNGGFGGKGGYGGTGGVGGKGGDGPGGPNGPEGQGKPYKPNKIEYIGRKTYANRYPYIHKVIKAFVDAYVSSDILTPEGSTTHSSKVHANKEVAIKCHYLTPPDKFNTSESVTQYV